MRRKKLWTLWDADDTILGVKIGDQIVGTAEAYQDVLRRYADAMEAIGFDRKLALDTQQQIDMEAARKVGFADKSRFPTSLRKAYETLATSSPFGCVESAAQAIEDIGWSVFTAYPYVALPYAIDVLAKVSEDYNIAIVTKGEEQEQQRKVFESGCFVYADQVIVMSHKSVEEWDEKVVKPLKINTLVRGHSWAIGNSVKSDVNPPMELGFNGIHIASAENWAFEHAAYGQPREGRQLKSVMDIRDTLPILFPE